MNAQIYLSIILLAPVVAAALIGGGVSLGGGLLANRNARRNQKAQAEQNAKDRQFQLDMYHEQRRDAIEDWNRVASYNSPQQQMIRLKQAGLNPNLVYGKGADATMTQMVRGANPDGGNQIAPTLDWTQQANAINNFGANVQTWAQTDNIYAQNALLKQQELHEAMKIAETGVRTAKSQFDLDLANELRKNTIEKSNLELDSMKANIQMTLDENERRKIMNASQVDVNGAQIAKTYQDILESKMRTAKTEDERAFIKKQIENLEVIKNDTELAAKLKAEQLRLYKDGIGPNAPYYIQLMSSIWEKILK